MVPEHTLLDNFEYQGYWWLPDHPENKVAGTLIRKDQQITLKLLNALAEESQGEMGIVKPPPRPEVIFGWLTNNQACTLYKNFQTGKKFHIGGGIRTEEFISQMLFLGSHYSAPSEFQFTAMTVSHTNMEEWMCYNPFSHSYPPPDGAVICAKATYTSFPEKTFRIPALNAEITFEPQLSSQSGIRRQIWEHSAFLKLSLTGDRSLNRYLALLSDFRNLLTLLIGEPVRARTFLGQGQEVQSVPGVKHPETTSIIFAQDFNGADTPIQFMDMLVTYPVIQEYIGTVIANWLSKAEELRTVCDLYFATIYQKKLFLRYQLLSLAQALESYARIRTGDHEGKKKLRLLIGDLLNLLNPATAGLIFQDRENFIETLADTRDYFTHYLHKHKEREALQGTELFHFNQRLRLLLTIFLLKEAGLDERLIADLISHHPKLMQWFKAHPKKSVSLKPITSPFVGDLDPPPTPKPDDPTLGGLLSTRLPANGVEEELKEIDHQAGQATEPAR